MNPLDELNSLTTLFPGDDPLFDSVDHVPSAAMPEPYRELLAHNEHMTVAMEKFCGSLVDVKILDRRQEENVYARKIVLTKTGTDDIVQFGIVRFNLEYVTKAVRDEILKGETPLGRILIEHNVLRHVDLGAVLRITAGPELARCLQTTVGTETYGRLATIFCNKFPAVDLLEIPAPVETLRPRHRP